MTIKGNFKRDCTIYARSNKSNSYDFFETPSFVRSEEHTSELQSH